MIATQTQTQEKTAGVPTAPAVRLVDMTVGYDGTPILQDTDLAIDWGQIVGVIGPNGSGKSTLIKTILGTLRAMRGAVQVGGYPARSKEARDLIGYVPQREVVNWDFPVTVADVVMMGRTARLGGLRFPGPADRRIVADALDQVGMGPFANRQISQLSGGQQQRVFLARALAQGGRLLLLDEPLNGVDANTQETICALLRRVRDEGGTVLMATHDLELAASWCDRLIMVNHAVIAYGTPAEALRPEVLRLTYGGQVLVLPSLENGDGKTSTIVPDAHGHPGGQPEPGTQTKVLR
jgi:manganese/zinc/iron transport system ATP- binding protein